MKMCIKRMLSAVHRFRCLYTSTSLLFTKQTQNRNMQLLAIHIYYIAWSGDSENTIESSRLLPPANKQICMAQKKKKNPDTKLNQSNFMHCNRAKKINNKFTVA